MSMSKSDIKSDMAARFADALKNDGPLIIMTDVGPAFLGTAPDLSGLLFDFLCECPGLASLLMGGLADMGHIEIKNKTFDPYSEENKKAIAKLFK